MCRKRINILFFLLIMLINFSLVVNALDEYNLVVENRYLKLYLNYETTEVAIQEKGSNNIWYSNPQNLEDDPIAHGATRNRLRSQFSITYYSPRDSRASMHNYVDSVAHDQYNIENIENGVKIEYTLGEQWEDDAYLPIKIFKERMEELVLKNIPEEAQGLFTNNYELMILEELQEGQKRVEVSGISPEEVFGEYTLTRPGEVLDKSEREGLLRLLTVQMVENREGIESRSQLTKRDFEHLVDNPVYVLKEGVGWDKPEMIENLKQANYSPLMAGEDHYMNNIDIAQQNIVHFQIPVKYRIEEDNFIAEVITSEIEYPDNIINEAGRTVSFPLNSINFLPFFGAADQTDQGYMFVPDGSGALINLNNEKTNVPAYSSRVYGDDNAMRNVEESSHFRHKQVHLPVYGLKKDNKAFFSIIESGDSFARIRADIGGKSHSYNKVYSQFEILPFGTAELDAATGWRVEVTDDRSAINVYQSEINSEDISIRFGFLSDDEATYNGMAQYYQNYLANKYNWVNDNKQSDVPLSLEIIGGITRDEIVLGMPMQRVVSLTDFKELKEILKQLNQKGIEDFLVEYKGWLAGGLNHVFPDNVNIEKEVGSRNEFEELLNFIQNNNIDFYPEVNFLHNGNIRLFDGVNARKISSRTLNKGVAEAYKYDLVEKERIMPTREYVISPRHLENIVGKFLSDYRQLNVEGISLRYLGEIINADYIDDLEKLTKRYHSQDIHQSLLKEISSKNDLMLGANAYSLFNVNNVIEIPIESSNYFILDKDIPFYQMVVSGYMDYKGPVINLADSIEEAMLKTVETGSIPNYILTYESGDIIKDTDFDYLYSTFYDDWLPEISDFYSRVKNLYSKINNKRIVNHRQYKENVFMTEYENDYTVVVNYNDQQIDIKGKTIGGKDFVLFNNKEVVLNEN